MVKQQTNHCLQELADFKYALNQFSIIAITDAQGLITYANDNFCQMSEYSREELIGNTHRLINSSYHSKAFFKNLWTTISNGKIWQGEIYNRSKNNNYYWVKTTIIPFLDVNNRPWQYLAIREDITKRKLAEAALANQLQKTKLLSQITQAIRQSLDTQTIFQTTTKEIREYLNVDRVAILRFDDLSCYEGEFVAENVLSGYTSAKNRKVRDRCFADEYAVDYRQGKFLAIADIHAEDLSDCHLALLDPFQIKANLVIPLLQREKLWGLLCIHQCSRPRQWQEKEIDFVKEISIQLGIALNHAELLAQAEQKSEQLQAALTQLKIQNEYQAKIANQEKTLNQIIKNIRQSLDVELIFTATTQEVRQLLKCDRVVVYQFLPDWNGKFVFESVIPGLPRFATATKQTYWNDSYLQEYQGGKFRYYQISAVHNIYEVEHSDCHLEALEKFQIRAYLTVPVFINEKLWGLLAAYHHSCPRLWKQEEINLFEQVSNQLGVALQQAQLLHDLKQSKENADMANKAKSVFLTNMTHELRTPLNGILGYAQILRRDRTLTPQQSNGLKIIYNSGNHLLTLINDILDFSKIEARKLDLYPLDLHLGNFLSGVVGIIRMRAIEKDILFKYQALTPLPIGVKADEKRLRQVLLNLLGNAVKFTDRGQVIFSVSVVETHTRNATPLPMTKTLRFEVSDTGIGMSPQQLEKIFQAFEQVGDKKRQDEGTGLGLAISRQLVELMGSELQVNSNLGIGSTFWFEVSFPIVETLTAQDQLQEQERHIIGYQGSRKQILVVDDKEENRLVLLNMLEPLGFEVMLGNDGQQAVDIAKEIKPDCILTDLVMPVKTGFEAVKEIRNIPELENIVIIAISASVLDMDRQKSRRLGCDSFLAKPVDEQKLFSSLQEFLGLSWIYEQITEPKVEVQVESQDSLSPGLIAPPTEEMEILYELAMLGSMKKIRERAFYLEELDQQYLPFANRLKDLAQGFQEKAIVNLIEQYL